MRMTAPSDRAPSNPKIRAVRGEVDLAFLARDGDGRLRGLVVPAAHRADA
jgi:hypothetical protein